MSHSNLRINLESLFLTLCLYRIDAVELNASLQYDDPQDVFEREPFSVKVRSLRFGESIVRRSLSYTIP